MAVGPPNHILHGKIELERKNFVSTYKYKNHYELKQARKIALARFDYNCCLCGMSARGLISLHVHHCDNTNWNHSIDNLIVLCPSCHMKYFHDAGRPRAVVIQTPDWNNKSEVNQYRREYYSRIEKPKVQKQKAYEAWLCEWERRNLYI